MKKNIPIALVLIFTVTARMCDFCEMVNQNQNEIKIIISLLTNFEKFCDRKLDYYVANSTPMYFGKDKGAGQLLADAGVCDEFDELVKEYDKGGVFLRTIMDAMNHRLKCENHCTSYVGCNVCRRKLFYALVNLIDIEIELAQLSDEKAGLGDAINLLEILCQNPKLPPFFLSDEDIEYGRQVHKCDLASMIKYL